MVKRHLGVYSALQLLCSFLEVMCATESLLIVLGYLYSTQARYRIQPHNAKAVLAAAAFLGQQGGQCLAI